MTTTAPELSVVAVGDIMLGDSAITVGFGTCSRYASRGLDHVFADLASVLQKNELVIGNLECCLTNVGEGNTKVARDQMRAPESFAEQLRSAGFTALSVGNNHAMQHGDAGFARTLQSLRGSGILVLGLRGAKPWLCEPVEYISASGLRAILLAYSWRPRQYGSGEAPYAEVDEVQTVADVVRAKRLADHVIVSLHWGEEFVALPSCAEVHFAQVLADAGASLIVGHHPHVRRPCVRYKDSVIAFSLGNCVTDMLWMDELRNGLLLEATLTIGGITHRQQATRVDDTYSPKLMAVISPYGESLVALQDDEYRMATERGLSRQRSAAYAFLVRNIYRYPIGVLVSLVMTTLRNKIIAIPGRFRSSQS